jgi:hypothetical protein
MEYRSPLEQNKTRVSFSRGLLKYVPEPEPVVGRGVESPGYAGRGAAIPQPLYSSTPKEEDLWLSDREERERVQAENMALREKRYQEEISWQHVRIQHLEQLLDGERRMVDTLGQFANMPWEYQKARVDTHGTLREPIVEVALHENSVKYNYRIRSTQRTR